MIKSCIIRREEVAPSWIRLSIGLTCKFIIFVVFIKIDFNLIFTKLDFDNFELGINIFLKIFFFDFLNFCRFFLCINLIKSYFDQISKHSPDPPDASRTRLCEE